MADGFGSIGAAGEEDVEEPTSPKVPVRKRREKRAEVYMAAEGEKLHRSESHPTGLLLLRPKGSFAYVHDDKAKFSEGVQGDWTDQGKNQVKLIPSGFGYCYEGSFDESEVLGVCPTIILRTESADGSDQLGFALPAELIGKFSWLDPTHQEAPAATIGENKATVAELVVEEEEVEEPTSPKAPGRRRAPKEKRAYVYSPKVGEHLYCPTSHPSGMLLCCPDDSFKYVHDSKAMFSEGVQGVWSREGENAVRLEAKSFGWCYEGSFDENDIVGTCHTVTLLTDKVDENGRHRFDLPADLLNKCSWLDPTSAPPQDDSEVEPTSPKIPARKRRNNEKRARVYQVDAGERLFCPKSHALGMLLLRPDNTFAYVHDSIARFSEGVQGDWKKLENDQVRLEPSSFGWCYEENFDGEEIIGVCHIVTLCADSPDENGNATCIFSDESSTRFSWLDPTLPEHVA